MSNRFDLEQEILRFSQILDDIAELHLDSKELEGILSYYNHRYERLWNMFEAQIRADHRRNHGNITLDQIQAVTRLEVIDGNGRSYSKWNIQNKSFSFQDDGRTLKIFLDLHGTANSEGGDND